MAETAGPRASTGTRATMSNAASNAASAAPPAPPTRAHQPIILVRGFGGLGVEDEKKISYQGFNDGTVYPQKRGENYIYEGMILRFMKSAWQYQDATNVVGYYPQKVTDVRDIPGALGSLDPGFFTGSKVVIDPGMALRLLQRETDLRKSLWVFRYYDLDDRKFPVYGEALVRLIDFIRALAAIQGDPVPKVNIIAHSMGGLIVREAIQSTYPNSTPRRLAGDYINKIVTLGTPHQGISFQVLKHWIGIEAQTELEHFNPDFQADRTKETSFVNFARYFPPARLLTVVGTNYRSYDVPGSSLMNRLFSVRGEFGPTYNRSDGLVKQTYAQIPGAPRTFVHKCHGGPDSLVTARESFEVATRFFFGDVRVRLYLTRAEVKRGTDLFGKSEVFFGVSVKPRGVDFDLFLQSAEAENTYGPFAKLDLSDDLSDGRSTQRSDDSSEVKSGFDWAGPERMIWEGWLDTTQRSTGRSDAASPGKDGQGAPPEAPIDIVMRLDFYVGERDSFGIGFSDNVIFRKQYYARAVFEPELHLEAYPDERFARPGFSPTPADAMRVANGGWEFDVEGTGFSGTLRVVLEGVPEVGEIP